MKVHRLPPRRVPKPWGRRRLGWGHADPADDEPPVGEVWFAAPPATDRTAVHELLIKLLYTSANLSIQVHPDDAMAQALGHPQGKDESWLILQAEPGACIALGPERPLKRSELKSAVADGSVASLLNWRPVAAGDFFYAPAGTIHAIGAGITLVEVQQNVDLTLRLHDKGHGRALQVEAGVAASCLLPFEESLPPSPATDGRSVLHRGGAFVQELWRAGTQTTRTLPPGCRTWVLCLEGLAHAAGLAVPAGQCVLFEGPGTLVQHAGNVLVLASSTRPGDPP